RADPVAGVEDHVDVVLLLPRDLGQPVRERDLTAVPEPLLAEPQPGRHVPPAHEEVEVLHRAPDPEIALQRVATAHQELDAGRVQLSDHPPVEAAGWTRPG